MTDTNHTDKLSGKWVWFLGVIFGGIAILGLRNLHRTLLLLASTYHWGDFFSQIFFAVCFFVFLAYAVGVYFLLVDEYPYHPKKNFKLSGPRFLLDLAMAFLLYVVLISGTSPNPRNSTLIIFSAVALWHLGAMCWLFLASMEHHGNMGKRKAILAHIKILGGYVLLIFVWANLFIDSSAGYKKSFDFLWVICIVVFCVSIWRTKAVIKNQNETGMS
ncbi:hypothetical protein ACFLQ0_06525 [Nitrospinota bacterium]